MNKELPQEIQAKIDNQLPGLSIHFVNLLGWEWTFRCVESE